ncbi:hypothetical protein ACVWY2_008555 [Bradyrhizobium sp. JR6.1]
MDIVRVLVGINGDSALSAPRITMLDMHPISAGVS